MYEGYTHLLNLFVTCPCQPEDFFRNTRNFLESLEDCEGGVTRLMTEILPSVFWAAEPSGWKKSARKY